MTNYRNHDIKFTTVKKQHYQDGCCPECKACGKALRHVMQIDGNAYGHDCGAQLLGWSEKTYKRIMKGCNLASDLKALERDEANWAKAK